MSCSSDIFDIFDSRGWTQASMSTPQTAYYPNLGPQGNALVEGFIDCVGLDSGLLFTNLNLCTQLSIPVIMTTQAATTFGPCVPSIRSCLPKGTLEYDKKQFSMLIPEVVDALKQEDRKEVVLVGIETQICVSQTALDLQKEGYKVVVLVEAVSSSSRQERDLALRRMQSAGIGVTSMESWLFETLRSAEHESFKQISALLRRTKPERSRIVESLL
ncbi:hypothetical protein FE257_008128 [Aspergillus nanangensis]|uniref:Isochorismatase-like domain-containing protein n=1 Tax=Aspergillus nanangensis TaxID=2582783 RepID=A0AAD4GUZ9_ASPNN|nr:hypothetical protein FE257_008128 [Aspergillus nanangensis]